MTLIVHHLNNSRSQRILWMLEELGLPYEIRHYQRDAKTMLAPPELKRVHPLGKSPMLEDDGPRSSSRPARSANIWSRRPTASSAPPAHRDDALRYRQWLHYAEGSMMPPLLVMLVVNRIPLLGKTRRQAHPADDRRPPGLRRKRARPAPVVRRRRDDRRRHHDELPARSRDEPRRARRLAPATIAWVEKIHARPAYQAALAKGGPYAYA